MMSVTFNINKCEYVICETKEWCGYSPCKIQLQEVNSFVQEVIAFFTGDEINDLCC